MGYCDGNCEHLNEKRHKCELTGEKLTVIKYRGAISYTAHEHRGFCEKDDEIIRDRKEKEEQENE